MFMEKGFLFYKLHLNFSNSRMRKEISIIRAILEVMPNKKAQKKN